MLKRVDSLRQGLLHLTPGPSTPGPSLQSNVLDLLERYRLAYPVDRGAHFIPTRCKDDPPANLFKELFPASAVPASAQLDGIRLTFCGTDPSKLARLPGGFVESVIVSLHSLLSKNFQGERGEGPPGVTHQWRQGTLFQGVLYPERASNSGALSHLKLAILVHVPPGTESLELLWMVRPAEAADSEIGPPASESPTFHGWHVFRGFCLDSIAPIAEKVSLFARPSLEVLVPASLPLDPPRESSFKTTHGAAPKPFQHNPAYHWQPPLAYKGWKKALPDHRPEVGYSSGMAFSLDILLYPVSFVCTWEGGSDLTVLLRSLHSFQKDRHVRRIDM